MTIHIANTNFEWELEQESLPPLEKSFEVHKLFLQLQFLPLLYAGSDCILVTAKPKETGNFCLYSEPLPEKMKKVESWGASRMVAKWAKEKGLEYQAPDFDLVKELASKSFSFGRGPKLRDATLLTHLEEANEWVKNISHQVVLKKIFGFSGRGHHILPKEAKELPESIARWCEKEWAKGRPIIGEPWVERLFDFSSQWDVGGEISYLGACIIESDPHGSHLSNAVGDPKEIFGPFHIYLEEHLTIAWPLIEEIQKMGYFGHLGIDAMVYRDPEVLLHPIVEINPRKTMGWLALEMLKKSDKPSLILGYRKGDKGLLPSELNGISFPKQLEVDAYPILL